MRQMFTLLTDIIGHLIQAGSTGVPIIQLGALCAGDSMMSRPLGKALALIGYSIHDEQGNLVENDLALRLSEDGASSVDLTLKIELAIATGRPGLSAAEILLSVAKTLSARGHRLGEEMAFGLELEMTTHTHTEAGVDYFEAVYSLVIMPRKGAAKA